MTALFASGTAEFSACEVYRYWLTRELNGEVRDREGDRVLVSCGLNPSVADAEKNDPTIRKDIGFAMRWGCGKLVKVNGYGYRSTDPNAMKRAGKSGIDIVGPDNDHWIGAAVRLVMLTDGIFMCNWGNHIEPARQRKISEIIEFAGMGRVVPMCLGTNNNGSPVHELYQPYERPLVPWVCP